MPKRSIMDIAAQVQPSALVVYFALSRHDLSKPRDLPIVTIAAAAGVSERTVRRALAQLERLGIIDVERREGQSALVSIH